MAQINYRTVDVDAYDPEAAQNFDVSTLTPNVAPVSAADVQSLTGQIRSALRGGDAKGALGSALASAPYGADAASKDAYATAVIEILQSIRQSEITGLLEGYYRAEGGSEMCDVLMKYLYKGMGMAQTSAGASAGVGRREGPAQGGFSQIVSRGGGEGSGQMMSVLLSWHEKVVEVAGPGCLVRVMTDRRTV